jgi:hypothetical protein
MRAGLRLFVLHTFTLLSLFPIGYFPLWVSPLGRLGVLEGLCFQPPASLRLFSERRRGAHGSLHQFVGYQMTSLVQRVVLLVALLL